MRCVPVHVTRPASHAGAWRRAPHAERRPATRRCRNCSCFALQIEIALSPRFIGGPHATEAGSDSADPQSGERERERERDREERERGRERDRERRERERGRETETEQERERVGERDRDRAREREGERETETEQERERGERQRKSKREREGGRETETEQERLCTSGSNARLWGRAAMDPWSPWVLG